MNRKGPKLIFAVLLCVIMVTMFAMMISRIVSPPEQDTPEPVSVAEPEKPRSFIPDKKNPDDPEELTAFDAEHGLKYRGHITGTDSCALWTVSDHCENDSDWSMTMTKVLELPDKFPAWTVISRS